MGMVLKVSTGICGSTRTVDLGYEREEWDDMSDEQREEIRTETMWNVIDVWVEEG